MPKCGISNNNKAIIRLRRLTEHFAEVGVVEIGILVGQPLAFNFGPDHEGVHGPSDALLAGLLLVGRRLFAADAPADAAFDRSRHVGHHHPARLRPAH